MFYLENTISYYARFDEGMQLVDPKKLGDRPIVNLCKSVSQAANQHELTKTLEDLGFKEGAFDKICEYIGNGKAEKGKKQLFQYIQEEKVTIERIGYSKKNNGQEKEAKFYLVFNNIEKKGGNNSFRIGFSRAGKARAILRRERNHDVPELAKILSDKETFSSHIQMRCSRIMNSERGIKAAQLGKCDLKSFDLATLSKFERFNLYISIFEGLNVIHKIAVHQDVNPKNIVVDENNLALFIDLDTMKKEGDKNTSQCGTIAYYSPERLEKYISGETIMASGKDDIWAAMLCICALEAALPDNMRMISNAYIRRYWEYAIPLHHKLPNRYEQKIKFLKGKGENLFSGIKSNPKRPLDEVVYKTAYIDPNKRYNALEVLMEFSGLDIPKESLFERILSPFSK